MLTQNESVNTDNAAVIDLLFLICFYLRVHFKLMKMYHINNQLPKIKVCLPKISFEHLKNVMTILRDISAKKLLIPRS